MTLLNSIFLWAGIAAAVPIVIHLLSKKKRVVVPWGAMQFLMEKPPQRHAKFLKLNELLVLLLRILAILLLALAFSRPLSNLFSGSPEKRDLVFILDASLSSSLEIARGQTILERQKQLALDAISTLSENDSLRVLVTSNKQHWLTDSATFMTRENRRALISQIRDLEPTQGHADFQLALQEALAIPAAEDGLPRQITIFSDGTSHGWQAEDANVWTSTRRLIKESTAHVEVLFAANTLPKTPNLVVEEISLARETVAPASVMDAHATIRNASSFPSATRKIRWQLGKRSIGRATIPPLSPNQATTIALEFSAPSNGVHTLTCRVNGDDLLPLDNTNSIAFEVFQEIPVLVVDSSLEENPDQPRESGFFLAALGHHPDSPGSDLSLFRPKVISPDQLGLEELSQYRCVVLTNVPKLSQETASQVEDYLSGGGGLWIALGDAIPAGPYPFSPAKLLGPIAERTLEDSIGVRPPLDPDSPLALLSDLERLDTDRIRLTRYHRFETPLPSGTATHLSAEGGDPLILEHSLGAGRIVLSSIPLNRAWSNFPLTQSYVVAARELLWHLVRPQLVRRNLPSGSIFSWRPPQEAVGQTATIEFPYGATSTRTLSEAPLLISDTSAPGVYRITTPNTGPQSFTIHRDKKESHAVILNSNQQSILAERGGLALTNAPLKTKLDDSIIAQSKNPIWSLILFLILAFFLIEVFLAQRLLKIRRTSRATATPSLT